MLLDSRVDTLVIRQFSTQLSTWAFLHRLLRNRLLSPVVQPASQVVVSNSLPGLVLRSHSERGQRRSIIRLVTAEELKMQLARHLGAAKWRYALILLAICSLTLSLATRFSVQSSSQSHSTKTVDRRSAEPKQQHLDRDATHWVVSTAYLGFVEPSATGLPLDLVGPPLPRVLLGNSLYNRPPPAVVLS